MSVNSTVLSTRSSTATLDVPQTKSRTAEPTHVIHEGVRSLGQCLELGPGNASRQRRRALNRSDSIVRPRQDESRGADGTKNAANIDLQERLPQPRGHRRTRAHPLIPAVEVAKSRYVGNLAEEQLSQRAFAPMTFDGFQMLGLLFGGKSPGVIRATPEKTVPPRRTSPVTERVLGTSPRTRGSSGHPRTYRKGRDDRPSAASRTA